VSEVAANALVGLRERMAELSGTDADDWFLTFKARHGLMAAFSAIREALDRDVVVTSPFTCVTAVAPMLSAGMPVRFADITPETLWLDADEVALGDDVAAVVLQHTFGITSPADATLVRRAHEAGAVVVEDCAHCVGRVARGDDGQPLADVSVHSFGVEKMLPGVYFGGAVWVSPAADERVRAMVRSALESLPPLRPLLALNCTQYRNQMRILTRVSGPAAARMRSRWERRRTFEPAVASCEREGVVYHHAAQPSPWIASQALSALSDLPANEWSRQLAVAAYLDVWGEAAHGLGVPAALVAAPEAPYLRMPVFLADTEAADALIAEVAAMGHYAQPWPRPLLLPGITDPRAFGVEGGFGTPVAEDLSERVVALPTDIEADAAAEVARAVLARMG
jgi:dTDP-4-amino-4,6-dideoxygalactose transaminase